jgi:hypothetical protein
VNEVAPKSPTTGFGVMTHATATHTVPVMMHKIDSVLVGQRRPSHRNAISRQLNAMKTASRRSRGVCGPTELPIKITGIAPRPKTIIAISRQVLFWAPRAARKAVSQ